MSGILRLESLTKGNTLKQGDKTPLKYRLFDADGEKLNIAGKTAKVRLVYPEFLTIGYEKDGLTIGQDDTVTFTIDSVIPPRMYHVEIIVDDQFIFPSRADESKFTVDKSSLGTDANIIEIVGVDAVARKATGMMKQDEEFIDDMIAKVISDTNVGNIEEYYNQFNEATIEFESLKTQAINSVTKSDKAIVDSASAKSIAQGIDAKASNALSLSESADTLSKSVQEQFNQVVIDGDSSVEAAQARVDANGQANATLKDRLDKEYNEVTTHLEHIYYQAPLPSGVDDSNMVKSVLQHCVDNDLTALFLPGDYMIEPNVITIYLKDEQQLKLKGFGRKTRFIRKNQTTTSNWKRLFVFEPDRNNTKDVDLVQIENLFIDSNARNQQEPSIDNSFEFQHSADVTVVGKEYSRVKNVVINSLYCDDGVADHLYFAGGTNNYIDSIRIENMEVYSRSRVRSDVTITGTTKYVYISNFNGQKIEAEINVSGGEQGILTINDSIVHHNLDMGGQMRNIEVSMNNIKSLRQTNLWHTTGHITNSVLTFSETPRINFPVLTFKDCEFRTIPDGEGVAHPIFIYTSPLKVKAKFINCTFEIVGEGVVQTSSALQTIPIISEHHDNNVIHVENCEFDERFQHSIHLNRSGTTFLKNNKYAGKTSAIVIRSGESNRLSLTVEGGEYAACSNFMSVLNPTALTLSLKAIIQDKSNSSVISEGSALSLSGPLFINTRNILVESDPTQERVLAGFKGDKYTLKTLPASGEAYEWMSTRTHHFSTLLKPLSVMP